MENGRWRIDDGRWKKIAIIDPLFSILDCFEGDHHASESLTSESQMVH
jgi:hypothetical protein